MHAVPKLQVGLENVGKLLAPGGRLLLQELSPSKPFPSIASLWNHILRINRSSFYRLYHGMCFFSPHTFYVTYYELGLATWMVAGSGRWETEQALC